MGASSPGGLSVASLISSSMRLKAALDRLQLVPRRHELAHRLQRAHRQHVGGDQGADRHVMVDDLAHADHDDRQRGEKLQAARGAGGDVGEVVGAEAGPGRLLDARLPALLDLGLEAQRLDGGGVGHGLGQRRALGGERLEILVGQPALRAMGRQRHADQHRDGERSSTTPSSGLMAKVAARNSATKAMSIASTGIWPVRKLRSTSSWRRRSAMTPDGVRSKCR